MWWLGGQGVKLFDWAETFCPLSPTSWPFFSMCMSSDPRQGSVLNVEMG